MKRRVEQEEWKDGVHRSLRNPILGVHACANVEAEAGRGGEGRKDIYCNPPSMQTCKISWAAALLQTAAAAD